MEGINRVMVVGNLGNEPDLVDASGTSILRMSVGVNERYKNRKGDWVNKVTWIPVSLFGKRAETLHRKRLVRKGTLVAIEGRLNPRSYEGRDGQKKFTIDVQASQRFSFWETGRNAPTHVDEEPAPAGSPPPDDMPPPPDDDDMPF
jgi:single-strand DNA-binding protein